MFTRKTELVLEKSSKEYEFDDFKSWTSCLLDVIFPRYCIYSGEAISPDEPLDYLSRKSLKAINLLVNSTHTISKKPCSEELPLNKSKDHLPRYRQNMALWSFDGLGEALIHRLKYQKERFLLLDIEKIITNIPDVSVFLKDSILVPVPLHPHRMRQRGFNQSKEIAKILAKIVPSSSVFESLKRINYKKSQVGLSRKKRLINVKNAFASIDSFLFDKSMRYIIVDDVYTTGATASACATVLLKKGITKIDVFTLAHG